MYTNCSWLAHVLFTTFAQLLPIIKKLICYVLWICSCLFMTCSQSVHDYFTIFSNLSITFFGLVQELFVTCTCLVHNWLKTFSQLKHRYSWLVHVLLISLTEFSQLVHELLILSWKSCEKSLIISEHVINKSCTSHNQVMNKS